MFCNTRDHGYQLFKEKNRENVTLTWFSERYNSTFLNTAPQHIEREVYNADGVLYFPSSLASIREWTRSSFTNESKDDADSLNRTLRSLDGFLRQRAEEPKKITTLATCFLFLSNPMKPFSNKKLAPYICSFIYTSQKVLMPLQLPGKRQLKNTMSHLNFQ